MAGLLRQGARRLGGSMVWRTQAAVTSPAVEEERRRLVTRRMYTTQEQAHGGIAREIQQKKDELYHLINEGENDIRTCSWTNTWLLLYLSGEVTPRPRDSNWCELQKIRETIRGIKRFVFFSLTFAAVEYYRDYSNDENVAPPAMMMEEEQGESKVETRSSLLEN